MTKETDRFLQDGPGASEPRKVWQAPRVLVATVEDTENGGVATVDTVVIS